MEGREGRRKRDGGREGMIGERWEGGMERGIPPTLLPSLPSSLLSSLPPTFSPLVGRVAGREGYREGGSGSRERGTYVLNDTNVPHAGPAQLVEPVGL